MAHSIVGRTFRHTSLPYCLARLKSGAWIALNRHYKPLGWLSTEWVDYETADVPRMKLTTAQLRALSRTGETDGDMIWLYADASIPTDSPGLWQVYSERLSILASAAVDEG